MNPIHFSSKNSEWETPWALYVEIKSRYRFDFNLDVCASAETTKCDTFFDQDRNGLNQDWHGICWMNPPYGRDISKWVKKASEEFMRGTCSIVALLPSRTDTKWFHEYVVPYAEVILIRGRIKFEGAKNSAPFPSMLAIYRNKDITP